MTHNGQMSAPAPVTGRPVALREAMGRFATGVTVVTANGEVCHGMTANAFSSVSLDPPLVLVCVARSTRMHEAITSARCFGVSLLGSDQESLARMFADKRRPAGLAQFDAVGWTSGALTGSPLLTGSLAWLECELANAFEGGDHTIFVGEVLDCRRGTGDQALLFYGGRFHRGITS